jgi:hypothetical protein
MRMQGSVVVAAQETNSTSSEVHASQAQPRPLLVRLGGSVVLEGSRISGSCPSVAAWLPIPPYDLLLVSQ